jgi:glucose/arabinose dehydrogenase/plastocyanin
MRVLGSIASLVRSPLSISRRSGEPPAEGSQPEEPKPLRSVLLAGAGVTLVAALFAAFSTGGAGAVAVTVDFGSNWYCDSSFEGGVCDTNINTGDTVSWDVLNGGGTHTVTQCEFTLPNDICTLTPGGFNSGLIDTASPPFNNTFTAPGTYEYGCELHDNMKGRVIVTDAATPTDTPPPTPPPTPSPTPSPTPVPAYAVPMLVDLSKPRLSGIAMIPGTEHQAVAITVEGDLWRIDISGPAQPPVAFGSVKSMIAPRNGDEGLLGVAFEPGNSARIYINYTTGAEYYRPYTDPLYPQYTPSPTMPANPKRNRISRFEITGGVMDMASEQIIYESLRPGDWHTLNQIVFGPDGYLYAGSGDGGWLDAAFDSDHGQGVSNDLATIIRIDPNDNVPGHTIPPGNPYDDGLGPNADQVWSYGHRNPWRLSFDRVNGELWSGDVGQWGWEEVNHVVPGNYGWRIMENDTCRFGSPCVPPAGHILPRTAYCNTNNPSPACEFDGECAMIGGYVYRGNVMPELQGYYIYADFCSARIRAVDTNSPSSPPIILLDSDLDAGITSFAETPDGELLVVAYKPTAPGNAIHMLTRFGDSDGDGHLDGSDNCPSDYNPSQSDLDLDASGDSCDTDDDSDGYTDTDEASIGTGPLAPCGINGWPSNLNDAGDSANRLDILDVTSFVAPLRRFERSPGDPGFDSRWDIRPGASGFPKWINITDITTLTAGPTGNPPMLNGARAFGRDCPFPP